MKKILVLNGSPRVNGNTSNLIAAFTEGAESIGHQVTTFHLDSMNIHGCKGCYGGKNATCPDSPCVQKDDMDLIYPVYNDADVIVMASPLYFWNLTGQLRTAWDRLFAAVEAKSSRTEQKSGALLLVAAGDGFDNVVTYFDDLMARSHWGNLGHVLASGVNAVGDIKGKPILEEARKFGASI